MRFVLGFFTALVAAAVGLGAAIYFDPGLTARLERMTQGREPAPVPPPKPTLVQPPAGEAGPAANAPSGPPATSSPPRVVKKETYQDWVYSCIELPDDRGTPCGVSQQISNAQTRQTVFLWQIGEDGKGGFVSTWQTPTDIFVGRGLTLEAGTPKPLVIPFQLCTTRGCQAVATVEPSFLELLAKAEKATAKVYLVTGQEVTINVSVKGLSDALAELRSQQ